MHLASTRLCTCQCHGDLAVTQYRWGGGETLIAQKLAMVFEFVSRCKLTNIQNEMKINFEFSYHEPDTKNIFRRYSGDAGTWHVCGHSVYLCFH